ncbi:MAG: prepilin-type N-terminal cleavage/methylation domain-containing protein [Actinomycetota bacterium]
MNDRLFFTWFRSKVTRSREEEGFTMIEVLVSFTLLAIVTLGTVPLFVSGLRTSLVSKLDTGAKNLNQERIEIMRNLPFHIDVSSGEVTQTSGVCEQPARTDPTGCRYTDLLDTYFRSLTVATSTTTAGYVNSAGLKTSDEPATPFYRFVINPITGLAGGTFNQNRYAQYVSTQFLSVTSTGNTAAVTPRAGYDSQSPGNDFAQSRLVGVTVITTWTAGNQTKKLVSYTQIADGRPGTPKVTLEARVIALRVTGSLGSSTQLTLDAGISNANGSQANGSEATVQAQGARADIIPGGSIDGATATASAPPDTNAATVNVAAQILQFSGQNVSCFAATGASNVSAAIAAQQPLVASSANPAQGLVKRTGSGCNGGAGTPSNVNVNLGFSNLPDSTLFNIDTSQYMVRVDDTSGSPPSVSGQAYLQSSGGSGHSATSFGSANSQLIKILPTTFAPQGLVQVFITSASLTCTTNGTIGSASAAFNITVNYWKRDPLTGSSAYVSTNLQQGNPLVSPLSVAVLNSTQVTVDGTGLPVFLSSYIDTWNSLVNPISIISNPATSVTSNLGGIVQINTKPTRSGDPTSTIGIQVGSLTCTSEDNR